MDEYKGQPRPEVQLVGQDGNAYAIMGRVGSALKDAGCSQEHVDAYYEDSKNGLAPLPLYLTSSLNFDTILISINFNEAHNEH